jgi:anti-sigma regulatory factor (Ser/Thr protein kinase)
MARPADGYPGHIDDSVRVSLPSDPTSPRAARQVVVEALREWSLPQLADALQLLASELVTNVLLHAPGTITLELKRSGQRVRIEVRDEHRVVPRTTADRGAGATTGRGLLLVEAMAQAWGVELVDGDGKVVWAEVAA